MRDIYVNFFRKLKIIYLKVLRSKGTTHSIALSVAVGIFVGLAIPVGFHTVTVIVLAFVLRTDKIIAFIATWIANPYTIPVVYPFFCYVGSKILGIDLPIAHINKELFHIFSQLSWDSLKLIWENVLICFLLGGAIFGLIGGVISYFISYKVIEEYRVLKERHRRKKYENYLK